MYLKIHISTLLAIFLIGVTAYAQPGDEVSFNRDIRPILSDKCFHCHGPDEHSRETELRFDEKESAFSDLGGYHAIVAGSLDDSELITRILSDDEDEKMPPDHIGKPLTEKEISLLKKWIESGANWESFWAYEPPTQHAPPKVESKRWSKHWIDQFVYARLVANGLTPSPSADKVTLIRRTYFDLIGLPPTPEQVQAFLADDSENAFEKVVDQLLASPHFGEKMAIYWLDLVRFADTVGYHGDQVQNISPYRDWVINAFNSNMPFDQFTREQLAGDLLPNPTMEQKIASGYNRLLQTTHEGGLQPKEYRAIYAADRVRNVSMVWMGATVGCAQCHDHKYDPYTAKDFYSLAAFFADIDDEQHFKSGTNRNPTRRSPEILVLDSDDQAKLDKTDEHLAKIRKNKSSVERELKKLGVDINGKNDPKQATDNEKLSPEANSLVEKHKTVSGELKKVEARKRLIESRGAWTMISQPLKTPRETRVFPRGNWLDETGPIVQPAIPTFMGKIKAANGERATRLDLANWLTDKESDVGKLTARVLSNRIWYLLMGTGVSRSLDDFGGQGLPPAYPELLDNLSMELLESGWDIKHLIRKIVLTKTYQQASFESEEIRKLDPYNELYSHQATHRLSAEVIRDNALAISGLLNVDEVGGKSVRPYQPSKYYRHLNFPTREYKHDKNDQQWRRGVYVHWQRQFLHPTLKALDAPTREECTAQRPRSNTPLAALSLLNDPTFVEAARHFARRVRSHEPSGFKGQLDFAFELALSRKPVTAEVNLLQSLYRGALNEFEASPERVEQLAQVGDARLESFDAKDAAWTIVARAILNLDETITRQ